MRAKDELRLGGCVHPTGPQTRLPTMTPHATRSLPFDQPVSFMLVTPALKPGVQTRTPRKRARRRLMSRLPSVCDRSSPVVAVLPARAGLWLVWELSHCWFSQIRHQAKP